MIFASGDGGVAGSNATTPCTSFVPTFTSTCPYVTSVGGTVGIQPEQGAGLSAGGLSDYFSRSPSASYQNAAVQDYLNSLGTTYAGLFDSGGRAYPDVSLQSTNYGMISGGKTFLVNGTSASAPVFASMIALVNDRLIASGKSPGRWHRFMR